MKNGQRGFVHFPDGVFETLFALALIGLVAAVAGGLYGLWWLLEHVRFV